MEPSEIAQEQITQAVNDSGKIVSDQFGKNGLYIVAWAIAMEEMSKQLQARMIESGLPEFPVEMTQAIRKSISIGFEKP